MVPPPAAAFTALLVLIGAGSTVHGLPDPQNVSVSCVNQVPVVRWDYGPQQPQTRFSVHIKGNAGNREYKTAEHELDLRRFVWESEERYMAYHVLTVTAELGPDRSNPVDTASFSYNQLKSADVTCQLDFPPVNLAVNGSEATLSILNPFSFYPELKRAVKPRSASFWFQISVRNDTSQSWCEADQRICRYDFTLPEEAEPCINLTGWLVEGNRGGLVGLRDKDHVCQIPSRGLHWGVVVFLLAVFAVAAGVIIFIICKTRAWTLTTPALPKPLNLAESNSRDQDRYSALDSGAVMSRVQVVDIRASIDSVEDSLLARLWGGGSGPGSGVPGGSGPQNPLLYMEGELWDGQRTDDDSAETESVSMNSTEEEEPAYDRPHVLQMDMGGGDTVTVYKTS